MYARSAKPAVEAFQTAYNENYKLLGGGGTISVDGIVGKQTWGAIYDIYQYNLAFELGEDFDGLKSLRELVEFLPTKNPYIGFGEHHPADSLPKPRGARRAQHRREQPASAGAHAEWGVRRRNSVPTTRGVGARP